MAPFPVRKLICSTGKKCMKVLKKLGAPRREVCPQSPEQGDFSPDLTPVTGRTSPVDPVTSYTSREEDCKSSVTIVTWLDDVRDLEDMENRLNEALELKMKKGDLYSTNM
ncbi:uncharacterized protein [Periplaneta americana]|uniref:uncharacterized protein n=1 Tax=Periplaneta americana TaxID=6978 RepID=UPI0037E9026D